jgi:hypothetical protein
MLVKIAFTVMFVKAAFTQAQAQAQAEAEAEAQAEAEAEAQVQVQRIAAGLASQPALPARPSTSPSPENS